MNRIRLTLMVAALAFVALLPACSSIDRQWASARSAPADPYAGRWEGRWRSTKSPGEGGKLRCVFTQLDAVHYRAAFEAHWKAFTTAYTAIFETESRGPELRFRGTHQLPAAFGGVYHYRGTVVPGRFAANYESSYDRGTFEMSRPQP